MNANGAVDVKSTPVRLAGRKGACAGTFFGRWPEMDEAFEGATFRGRPLFSLHEGAWSPDRVERELAGDPIRRLLKDAWPDRTGDC